MHTVLVYLAVQKQILWYTDFISLEMSWTRGYFQKELGGKKTFARSILCLCERAERSDLCPGTNAFLWCKKAMLCVTGSWRSEKENGMSVMFKPLI